VAFHRAVVGQLWTGLEMVSFCGVLQELMSRELEDEKVSITIGKRTMFSIGCFFPVVVFFGTMLDGN
jgi:hypothetical protein